MPSSEMSAPDSVNRSRFFRAKRRAVLLSVALLALALGPSRMTAQFCQYSCPDGCDYDCGSYELCNITGPSDSCMYPGSGCPPGEQRNGNCCGSFSSPILLDVEGDGFALTNLAGGVYFAFGPTSFAYRAVSYTHLTLPTNREV